MGYNNIMIEYYVGTFQECINIDNDICFNCLFPSNGTINWCSPIETIDNGVFVIEVPQGSHGFTKEQMNKGIAAQIQTNVLFPVLEV